MAIGGEGNFTIGSNPTFSTSGNSGNSFPDYNDWLINYDINTELTKLKEELERIKLSKVEEIEITSFEALLAYLNILIREIEKWRASDSMDNILYLLEELIEELDG